MSTTAAIPYLCPCVHSQLRELERDKGTPTRLRLKAKIILAASYGQSISNIVAEFGVTRQQVLYCRARFYELGVGGLMTDQPRIPMTTAQLEKFVAKNKGRWI